MSEYRLYWTADVDDLTGVNCTRSLTHTGGGLPSCDQIVDAVRAHHPDHRNIRNLSLYRGSVRLDPKWGNLT